MRFYFPTDTVDIYIYIFLMKIHKQNKGKFMTHVGSIITIIFEISIRQWTYEMIFYVEDI